MIYLWVGKIQDLKYISNYVLQDLLTGDINLKWYLRTIDNFYFLEKIFYYSTFLSTYIPISLLQV